MRQHMLPELARMIADPRGREALAIALAQNPGWRQDFFLATRSRKIDSDDAYDLLQRVRAQNPRLNVRGETLLYIQALVGDGQARRARQLWLNLMTPEQRARQGFVFDPQFQ